MEDEITYSTLAFYKGASPSKEQNEEQVIYSGVKIKAATTTETNAKEDVPVYSGVKPAQPQTTDHTKDEATADPQSLITKQISYILLLCLGILCIVLVGSIIGIAIYFTTEMNKQDANLRDLNGRNEQLIVKNRALEKHTEQLTIEKRRLENQTKQLEVEKRLLKNQTEELRVMVKVFDNQTKELSRERDDLNWTLGVILKFNNFPLNDFCPNSKCQPCRTGWIQYNKKCYLFYEESPWKTWTESRQYCRDKEADLVVIDDLQEQQFISNNTKPYFDNFHGYWMGLQKTGDRWVWIDGHHNALQYWRNLNEKLYGLMIPGTNPTQSWDSGDLGFLNKFICEDDKVLIRPD